MPCSLPNARWICHHPAQGARNQRVRITAHPDRRHQVLEHGARPGNEHRLPIGHGVDAAQLEPALLRRLSLGHGNERSNAGFAAKQVIAGLVQMLALDLIPDREQQARRSIRKPKSISVAKRIASDDRSCSALASAFSPSRAGPKASRSSSASTTSGESAGQAGGRPGDACIQIAGQSTRGSRSASLLPSPRQPCN